MAGKHYVIATQNGYIVDNVSGYPEEFATKQLAVKALTELVRDAAERCRRSYKTCSVVGTARDGDVKIRVGGRQGYNLWERFIINERAGSRKPRKESVFMRELREGSQPSGPSGVHATKKSSAQLDREIATAVAAHARKKRASSSSRSSDIGVLPAATMSQRLASMSTHELMIAAQGLAKETDAASDRACTAVLDALEKRISPQMFERFTAEIYQPE